jgi:hypothetical protein
MLPQDKELVVSYLTLRQLIGWAGLLMPFAVRVGAYVFEHIYARGSISAYYYMGMRDVFVSTLVLVGTLLICYRTPARKDNVVAIIAGLAAVGIGLFPMDENFAKEILVKHAGTGTEICYFNRGILGCHFYFVTLFFALSFYLVYFRFSAFTPQNPSKQKLARNKIYKVCGLAMLVGSAAIGIIEIYNSFDKANVSIFWPETLAVASFAVAWLVKGRVVLKER